MSVVIVVNSCDAYSDLWDLFFLCMSDYWGGCEYPIILNTESKCYSLPVGMNFEVRVHQYASGSTDHWGARLLSTLNGTEAEFVIVLYDDFFLNAPVIQERLMEYLGLMSGSPAIDVIYLTKLLGVEKGPAREDGLAVVNPTADYRLNSSPAIWRKDALIKFTGRQDNPWAWEYFGSYRTFSEKSIFLAIADSGCDVYPYDYRKGGAIYRGKWVKEVINPIIEKHNLTLDLEERGTVDSAIFPKRNIYWKLSFFATGFRMIGYKIFYAIYKIIGRKFSNWFRNLKGIPSQ